MAWSCYASHTKFLTPSEYHHQAVSIDAQVAAGVIRERIPAWQPIIEPGFQGRMILLFIDAANVVGGTKLGRPYTTLFGVGTDGQIRAAYKRHLQSVARGHVGWRRIESPIEPRHYETLVDHVLGSAIPVEQLLDGRSCYAARVCDPRLLRGARRDRHLKYADVGMAPTAPDDDVEIGRIVSHCIRMDKAGIGTLYALAETFGSYEDRQLYGFVDPDSGNAADSCFTKANRLTNVA